MTDFKIIYLVRHAKSSWSNPLLNDRDRPLNKRGKHDAPMMAERLSAAISAQPEVYLSPTLLISSPAKRARRTAREFRKALQLPKSQRTIEETLYFQGPGAILESLTTVADCHHAVMIFSHNPDLTELYNQLTGDGLDNLPTCAVATLRFDIASWQALTRAKVAHALLDYPKLRPRQAFLLG